MGIDAKTPVRNPAGRAGASAARPIIAGDTRFLGFAFAGADLVIEFDEQWQILYGMALSESGPEQVRARTASQLIHPSSLGAVMALQGQLGPNARSEPLAVTVKTPDGLRRAAMRVFRARELGARLSCIFSFQGEAADIVDEAQLTASSLVLEGPDFLVRATQVLDDVEALPTKTAFTFLELTTLVNNAGRALSPAVEKAVRGLEGLLNRISIDGATAGKVREGRYVLMTDQAITLDALNAAIDRLGDDIPALLGPRAAQTPVVDADSPQTSIRALRFALERFAGKDANPDVATMATELSATLKDAIEFRLAVQERRFKLVYQPIVRLCDETVQTYEALLRLPGRENTGASIRMAEQLGLIDKLDVAVAEAAWRVLERDRTGALALSINISGAALRDDGFVQGLVDATRRSPSLRRRFTVEINEGAALEDLEAADRRVQFLRRQGFKVCVDDFGAGAASFDYLRALDIDMIKIDGRYIRDLATNQRSRQLVSHFVRLCGVMDIETLGAMSETRAQVDALRELGVDYAQGWFFGQPLDAPCPAQAA